MKQENDQEFNRSDQKEVRDAYGTVFLLLFESAMGIVCFFSFFVDIE
jgi:hypothetical protein